MEPVFTVIHHIMVARFVIAVKMLSTIVNAPVGFQTLMLPGDGIVMNHSGFTAIHFMYYLLTIKI